MTISDIIQLVTFLFSILSAGIATYSARVAHRAKNDLEQSMNTDNITLLMKRLDRMDIADAVLEKSGEQVRIRLVGLSGDNGLVHDIVRLKDEVAYLKTQTEVIADRLKMVIGKRDS